MAVSEILELLSVSVQQEIPKQKLCIKIKKKTIIKRLLVVTAHRSYSLVGKQILVVKNNVASALEIFYGFSSCLLNFHHFRY